jgi:uncharacterized membrane protein YsdA (DUF1294 family)
MQQIPVLFLILYAVSLNMLGILLMKADKSRARKGKWRIRESSFFMLALFGGAAGCLVGMYMFRHKTKHVKFIVGMPLLLLFHLFLLTGWFYR